MPHRQAAQENTALSLWGWLSVHPELLMFLTITRNYSFIKKFTKYPCSFHHCQEYLFIGRQRYWAVFSELAIANTDHVYTCPPFSPHPPLNTQFFSPFFGCEQHQQSPERLQSAVWWEIKVAQSTIKYDLWDFHTGRGNRIPCQPDDPIVNELADYHGV